MQIVGLYGANRSLERKGPFIPVVMDLFGRIRTFDLLRGGAEHHRSFDGVAVGSGWYVISQAMTIPGGHVFSRAVLFGRPVFGAAGDSLDRNQSKVNHQLCRLARADWTVSLEEFSDFPMHGG